MDEIKLILIIDDVLENIQVLGNMLEKAGYEVLVANTGAEALKIARSYPPPDLILLDIVMPSMDGFEVCRILKADPELKSIPVIFVSAISMLEHKLQAFREGGVDYISKPFQGEEVVARVGTHLKLANLDNLKREVAQRSSVEQALLTTQNMLASLTDELSLTEERERRRIALALHDQVVQKLALGKLKLDQALKKGRIPADAAVTDLQKILDSSMHDLRDLSTDLSPPLLYELGLRSAIANFGERLAGEHGFKLIISGDEALSLRDDVRVTLFQMARELLINMVKHASASNATVLIATNEESACIEVLDDGVGFDLPSCREGFGLAYIRQRVAFLGGTMKVFTAPGMGASIIIEIPADDRIKGAVHESHHPAGR